MRAPPLDDQIPMPAPPTDGKYNVAYFTPWMQALEDDWDAKKPPSSIVDSDTSFKSVLSAVTETGKACDAAEKMQSQLQRQADPPATKEVLDQAQAVVDAEKQALETCIVLLQTVAGPLLDQIEKVLSDDASSFDDANFVTLFILKCTTLQVLEDWCSQGETETKQIVDFLQDVPFMRRVLAAGGPYSFSKLGRAIQIYRELQEKQDLSKDPVLERLALAVSLELCVDLLMFGYDDKFVDPIQRFIHYSQAYLFGELDPEFRNFTVWELRMVVDCNAPNEQIGWGRQCLQNYRPDHCYSTDSQWRYCRIVRTDVTYTDPVWYKPRRTYDQILSSGGKCGPRAWYGRFACKSFGIPTWGVRQPGHAAMTRWTDKGQWMTCLGWGVDVSFWYDRGSENRGGPDFFLEADARSACATDLGYQAKVQRIEWMAYLAGESDRSIRKLGGAPSDDSPWYAISMMQRRILAAQGPTIKSLQQPEKRIQTRLETLAAQPDQDPEPTWERANNNERLVIPAALYANADKADVMASFLGGRQIFLHENGSAVYPIPSRKTTASLNMRLQLSLLVCTVHRNEKPLQLTVTTAPSSSQNGCVSEQTKEMEVQLPYTMGLWETTIPVVLPDGASLLKITRLQQFAGISIKELILY